MGPRCDENGQILQAAEKNNDEVFQVLNTPIPEFPADLSEPKQVVAEIEKFAHEAHEIGWALIKAKMTLYILERQKRATEQELRKTGQRKNPALVSQLDLLSSQISDANNLRYTALDRVNTIRDLLNALYQIRSALTGGF